MLRVLARALKCAALSNHDIMMASLRITFITGNAKKLAEVSSMLAGTKLEGVLVNQAVDLPELQGARDAANETPKPFLLQSSTFSLAPNAGL